MRVLGKLPLKHQPGERFTYSLGLDVLGYFVEVISGMPFDQFLRTRIFDPLGMKDTWFYLPEDRAGRLVVLERGFTQSAPGSVLIKAGRTTILCTASVEEAVPPWKARVENPSGWATAEYNMLPGSTSPRKRRDRNQVDGRTTEIQRLIGRSLRAIVDFEALGPRTITIDCDVLEADGGTRTLSITGGFIALADALASIKESLPTDRPVLLDSIAAVSVGIVDGLVLCDLDYSEDVRAEVDMNVVMTGQGRFVEVQGTAERGTFDAEQLSSQLAAARQGIEKLTAIQRETLGKNWPLDLI
jgi:ribonuclease PH